MEKLQEEVGRLWGNDTKFHPYLLEYVHGDGLQLIWFQYMEDRPRHYVVRVDSKDDVDDVDDEGLMDDVIGEVMDAIRDESTSHMSESQYDEFDNIGYFDKCDRNWPIPPLEVPCGYSWGTFMCEKDIWSQIAKEGSQCLT